jgi:hypothetical protein
MKISIGFFNIDREDSGIDLAELVKVLEFNGGRINKFPFMLDVYESNKIRWETMLKKGISPMEIAEDIRKTIADKIKNNNYVLSSYTIWRKQSEKALIDTGFLLNHIRIKIDDKFY